MHTLTSTLRRSVLVVLIGLGVFAGAASAQEATAEDQARAHFRLGRAHYDNGNFAQAAVEFEEAYNISQRSALLYNIYLAYRDANNTEKAAWALKLYLEKEVEVENRAQLQARLRALEEALAAAAAAGTTAGAAAAAQPAPAEQAPAQAQPTEQAQPETQPGPAAATEQAEPEKKSMVVPIVLMSTGGAMVLGSIATGAMASGKASDVEDLCPNGSCPSADAEKKASDADSSRKTLALVTDVLMFGGIAVAGTGAVLLVLNLMSGGDDKPTASVAGKPTAGLACMPGACHGSLSVPF
jgi:tetratricopeptide (TPR) repeat protein